MTFKAILNQLKTDYDLSKMDFKQTLERNERYFKQFIRRVICCIFHKNLKQTGEKLAMQEPVLTLNPQSEDDQQVLKALSSEKRLRILELLSDKPRNVSEIAAALDFPLSTANMHISSLEDAGLLITDLHPGERGLQKICARAYTTIIIEFSAATSAEKPAIELSMPIGAYVDCEIQPTCGLASDESIIGILDDVASFYDPERTQAQLLWFHQGYVEYRFPNRLSSGSDLQSLQLSLELCSEAPLHHDDYPSDITVSINNVELGTWRSPADFGGQQGALTPGWWASNNTQYGLLKIWKADHNGCYIDGVRLSSTTIDELHLMDYPYIAVKIEVKATAENVGGVNIFGQKFGNYPQDIMLHLQYR